MAVRKSIFAVVAILAVLAAGCGGGDAPPPKAATEVSEPDQPDFDYQAKGFTGQSESGERQGTSGAPEQPNVGGHSTVVGTRRSAPQQQSGPRDDAGLGTNSFFYLNRTVPKLIIEIDAVEGFAPMKEAVDLLVERLRSVADKPDGIQVLPYGKISGRDTWSVDDLERVERESRKTQSSLQAAVMHILYVDGSSDEGAVGVAYSSTGAALFIEDIKANEVPTVSAEAVEKAVLVHEVGHLLALVNITYQSPRDHEHPDSPGHSDNINSVMYPAVDNIGVFTVFRGLNREPPTDFDADDRADLADLRSGELP